MDAVDLNVAGVCFARNMFTFFLGSTSADRKLNLFSRAFTAASFFVLRSQTVSDRPIYTRLFIGFVIRAKLWTRKRNKLYKPRKNQSFVNDVVL